MLGSYLTKSYYIQFILYYNNQSTKQRGGWRDMQRRLSKEDPCIYQNVFHYSSGEVLTL